MEQGGNSVTIEESCFAVVGARGPAMLTTAEQPQDVEKGREEKAASVNQPLLLQQHVLGDDRKTPRPVTLPGPTDGTNRKTSVVRELRPDNTQQLRSVESQPNTNSLGDSECPICSELYNPQGEHQMALLYCDHTVCHSCLTSILKRAVDPSRVQCPLCRQKTPLIHREIQRMQEDILYQQDSSSRPGLFNTDVLPETTGATPRCFTMEQRLRAGMETTLLCRRCLAFPCLLQMQQHCRCCYLASLGLLVLLEFSCLLIIFLPVIMLVLLFTLVK